MNLAQLKALFRDAGCVKLYAKPLAENDNSKNQVYFGPGFEALNLFPNEGVFPDSSPRNRTFKAKLRFGWLKEDGRVANAPRAQLILYPQYPEVRMSGFLSGCRGEAPSELMAGRQLGRVLFLGVTSDQQIIAFAVGPGSEVAGEFGTDYSGPTVGVFTELDLPTIPGSNESRLLLLAELGRVHRLGWIESKQLAQDGTMRPCNAPQCGGFTLEAELGIPKNSRSEPDFHGWEIKQHEVASFERIENSKTITLMTPEPTGGFYKKQGLEAFIRRFGCPDMSGRPDRLNFVGTHRVNVRHARTELTLMLHGYDPERERITDVQGGAIALVNDAGEIAAAWAFSGLMSHWTRKHSKAAYVPSMCNKDTPRQYSYGHKVRLAQKTDFLFFLKAMAAGTVYYDPGIKLEEASSQRPTHKARSQFRITSRNIGWIYETVEAVEV